MGYMIERSSFFRQVRFGFFALFPVLNILPTHFSPSKPRRAFIYVHISASLFAFIATSRFPLFFFFLDSLLPSNQNVRILSNTA